MKTKFQTEVDIPPFKWKTGYQKRSIFMGSCFTENIGGRMEELKFPVDINPFGILYNPVSVAKGLKLLIDKNLFTKTNLIKHHGLWHSFYHHSRFSSPDPEKTLDLINKRINNSSENILKADFLFVTFGTSWVYEYTATNQIISNCHKIPEKEFRRFRLNPDEIVKLYKELMQQLWSKNPEIKIVFTVSPIRHWKDGAIENQKSKATLILAIDQLISDYKDERCSYFPAYEIVMDELRDYRFYADDMIHLSAVAVNHIWDIFRKYLIDEKSNKISTEVQQIINSVKHKPKNILTAEHMNFLKKSLRKTIELQTKNAYLNLDNEIKYFSGKINDIEKNK